MNEPIHSEKFLHAIHVHWLKGAALCLAEMERILGRPCRILVAMDQETEEIDLFMSAVDDLTPEEEEKLADALDRADLTLASLAVNIPASALHSLLMVAGLTEEEDRARYLFAEACEFEVRLNASGGATLSLALGLPDREIPCIVHRETGLDLDCVDCRTRDEGILCGARWRTEGHATFGSLFADMAVYARTWRDRLIDDWQKELDVAPPGAS